MNVANYLCYNKQNASVRVKFLSDVIFTLLWFSFTLNQVTISMCYLSKVPYLFPCGSQSFLNFRLSSTRLLIKWFLIKKRISTEPNTVETRQLKPVGKVLEESLGVECLSSGGF